MPDLETLVRDARPAPDPAWAARLDARVAAGFPTPPTRLQRARAAFRAHFLALGAVGAAASAIIVLVVLVGSSVQMGGGDDEAAVGGSGGSSTAAAPEMAAPDDAAGGGASTAAPERRAATPGDDRAVLATASITLSARPGQVETIADRAIRIVDTLGGYVETSEVSRGGGSASATLTLRIPSSDLDKGLAQLSRLAHVSARSQQAEDVTDERERLEALVRDARADREGLRSRLAKAATDKERSRLRALLDRASRRVTQRQRAVAQLGREVAYATVDLSIHGDRRSGGAAGPGDRWTPGDALRDAGRVLEVIAGVLLIAGAVLLPVAILGVLVVLAGRAVRQRRRERALGSA